MFHIEVFFFWVSVTRVEFSNETSNNPALRYEKERQRRQNVLAWKDCIEIEPGDADALKKGGEGAKIIGEV